jgi:hypothetical protein
MRRYLENNVDLPTTTGSFTKTWRRQLRRWKGALFNRRGARKKAAVVEDLDPRIRYDIGLTDYRALPPSPSLLMPKAYPLSAETMIMMKRSL